MPPINAADVMGTEFEISVIRKSNKIVCEMIYNIKFFILSRTKFSFRTLARSAPTPNVVLNVYRSLADVLVKKLPAGI